MAPSTPIEKEACRKWLNETANSLRWGGIEANVGVCAGRVHAHEDGWTTTRELAALASRQVENAIAERQLVNNQSFNNAMDAVFTRFPQYARVEANAIQLLSDYALVYPNDRTLDVNKLLKLAADPNVAEMMGLDEDYAEAREQQNAEVNSTTQMILEMLNAKYVDDHTGEVVGNGYTKSVNEQKMADEQAFFLALPYDGLRAKYSIWKNERDLLSKSVEELHAIVRGEDEVRLQQQLDSRYQPITSEYIIPGKTVSVPWSATLLQKLPHGEQERLHRLYGVNQLNAAIAGRR